MFRYWYLVFFSLIALTSACKRTGQIASSTLENGGYPVDWRVRSTLSSRGELRLEKTGSGAEADVNRIDLLQVEIATAPDGYVPATTVVDKKYFPLKGTDDDIRFNLLMNTRGGGLCYVNYVQLSGTNDPTSCKPDGGGSVATATDPEDIRRAALAHDCDRLSRIRIDAGSFETFAHYDPVLNKDACTCVNGKIRDLPYRDYLNKDPLEFDLDCKRRLSDDDTSINRNYNACLLLESIRSFNAVSNASGSAATANNIMTTNAWCVCGAKRLFYDDQNYNFLPDKFRSDCETAAGGG